jgi:hypothetical protein
LQRGPDWCLPVRLIPSLQNEQFRGTLVIYNKQFGDGEGKEMFESPRHIYSCYLCPPDIFVPSQAAPPLVLFHTKPW